MKYKPKKQVYQVVSKKNGASLSGTKKNFKVPNNETNSANLFEALNMIDNDDELRSNRGSSNSGNKVIDEVDGSAYGSPSITPLITMINELAQRKPPVSARFLDPGGGDKKNNKHVEHAARKNNNTNGLFGFGSDSGFPSLVDVTGTIHVLDGSLTKDTVMVSSLTVDEHVVADKNTKDVNVGRHRLALLLIQI
nr:hypothetical protein [Tanacetum cinerariifolium]